MSRRPTVARIMKRGNDTMGASYCRILDSRYCQNDPDYGVQTLFAKKKHMHMEKYDVDSGYASIYYMAVWVESWGIRIPPTVEDFIWGYRTRFSAKQCRKIRRFFMDNIRESDDHARSRSLMVELILLLKHCNRGLMIL